MAATNRRETADFEVPVAACSTWLPTGSVGAADPWTIDAHAAAAEGYVAGLGAVADRGPVGVVAGP